MQLDDYVPGDPGAGRSLVRPSSSMALVGRHPHDANTDHDCSLPTTGFVAAMALARCVARWITEGRLRFGVVHSGCCAGTLYMVVIKTVNRHIPAGGRTRVVGLKGRCPGRWTMRLQRQDSNLHMAAYETALEPFQARCSGTSCRSVTPTARRASPCGLPGLRLQDAERPCGNDGGPRRARTADLLGASEALFR